MTRTQQKDSNSLPCKGTCLWPASAGHSLLLETLSCSSFSDPHTACLPAAFSLTSLPPSTQRQLRSSFLSPCSFLASLSPCSQLVPTNFHLHGILCSTPPCHRSNCLLDTPPQKPCCHFTLSLPKTKCIFLKTNPINQTGSMGRHLLFLIIVLLETLVSSRASSFLTKPNYHVPDPFIFFLYGALPLPPPIQVFTAFLSSLLTAHPCTSSPQSHLNAAVKGSFPDLDSPNQVFQ